MKVKIQKIHELAAIPTQATEFAGGWDCVATEIIQESEDFVVAKLGIKLEFDSKYKLTLIPRSSLTKTKWIIQNSPGLGDADYRGEYQLKFRAIPIGYNKNSNKFIYPKFPYKVGDRVGQCYFEEVIPIEWEEGTILNNTKRGEGGYGSTNETKTKA